MKVLKRAESDINKFTDIEVKLSEKKSGKKVTEVTYSIRKNTTDLKTFIQIIRECYVNKILLFTKDNRPIICNEKGLLFYDDENPNIDKKESQKLWEYLHENREDLYVFKENIEELEKHIYLLNMKMFKEYLKENFAHKEIIKLKESHTSRVVAISIFPNAKLYDMSGESLSNDSIIKIWKIIFLKAKKGELEILRLGK